MKEKNRVRKIRKIVTYKNCDLYGIGLPSYLVEKWKDIFVYVRESGTCLILESGAKIENLSKSEINKLSKKIEEVEI